MAIPNKLGYSDYQGENVSSPGPNPWGPIKGARTVGFTDTFTPRLALSVLAFVHFLRQLPIAVELSQWPVAVAVAVAAYATAYAAADAGSSMITFCTRFRCRMIMLQICDYRCGNGRYKDLHCNWRGLGQSCRYCSLELSAARVADKVAAKVGARIVLCDTHEPPPPVEADDDDLDSRENSREQEKRSTIHDGVGETDGDDVSAATKFGPSFARDRICAFLPGYLEFLRETELAVSSVLHFMPGMRIGIATSARDFHVFNRYDTSLEKFKV